MLAFYSDHNHTKEFSIYIVPADGSSEPVEIAKDVVKSDRWEPAWSEDGKSIVYVLNDTENFNPLYLVDTAPPYKKTQIASNAQMHSDIDLVFTDGKTRIAFIAQGLKKDREKRWMRVYVADLIYE